MTGSKANMNMLMNLFILFQTFKMGEFISCPYYSSYSSYTLSYKTCTCQCYYDYYYNYPTYSYNACYDYSCRSSSNADSGLDSWIIGVIVTACVVPVLIIAFIVACCCCGYCANHGRTTVVITPAQYPKNPSQLNIYQPNAHQPNIYDPNTFQFNVYQPNVYQPNSYETNLVQPNPYQTV